MILAKLLLDAVGAKPGNVAAHVDMRFVDRVAERVAGVAADDQAAALRHEGAHVPDRAADDDVDALHRDAAACSCVAVHDEQASAAGRARGLARVPLDDNRAGHDVLRDAGAHVAVHANRRALVHAGAVVANVSHDLDLDRRVDPAGDGVHPVRVEHAPAADRRVVAGDIVQALVQLTQRGRREVDDLDSGRRDGHQTSAFSQA